jgi:outer membrane lipoprotein-sorting protein
MKRKITLWIVIVGFAVIIESVAIYILASNEPFEGPFKDDPKAHALYDKMVESMREADTLSFTSDCSSPGNKGATYTVWLKKPNYFRVETLDRDSAPGGTLIGDGNDLWIYWPGERPFFFKTEERSDYEDTNKKVYMRKHTPVGKHSIGHEVNLLGAGIGMAIIDPSTFHGYTDSLQKYLDGVRSMGVDKINGKPFDVIEVSFMERQRSWYLWLSRRDHLPRKIKQVVRVRTNIIAYERWFDVTINEPITNDLFVWAPPAGWERWEMPRLEDELIKPGALTPDFTLASADGGTITLSDYRGKIVWLYIWRAG